MKVVDMVEVETFRKEWWDEARERYGVSAVDYDFVPIGDGKVVVKAKVAAKDLVAAYGVVSEKDARSIGAAQVKALRKALQFVKGEFEKLVDDSRDRQERTTSRKRTKRSSDRTTRRQKSGGRRSNKYPPNGEDGTYVCEVCGAEISPGVARYSKDRFGVYLCMDHQKEAGEQEE